MEECQLPTTQKATRDRKAKPGHKVHFSAENLFAGDNKSNLSVTLPIAPDAQGSQALPGTTITLLQNVCQYQGFQIDGAWVIGSIVTGTLTRYPDGKRLAVGYEWGALDSGDHWLAEVSERGDAKGTVGTWKLLYGTGRLAGIEGEAAYENHPKAGATVVRSKLTGWYSIPGRAKDPEPVKAKEPEYVK
jgi:hypothetical protein